MRATIHSGVPNGEAEPTGCRAHGSMPTCGCRRPPPDGWQLRLLIGGVGRSIRIVSLALPLVMAGCYRPSVVTEPFAFSRPAIATECLANCDARFEAVSNQCNNPAFYSIDCEYNRTEYVACVSRCPCVEFVTHPGWWRPPNPQPTCDPPNVLPRSSIDKVPPRPLMWPVGRYRTADTDCEHRS